MINTGAGMEPKQRTGQAADERPGQRMQRAARSERGRDSTNSRGQFRYRSERRPGAAGAVTKPRTGPTTRQQWAAVRPSVRPPASVRAGGRAAATGWHGGGPGQSGLSGPPGKSRLNSS